MTCCCPQHADARTCFELRYYGYSPAMENDPNYNGDWSGTPEFCDCICHDKDDDDEEDW